MSSSESSNSDNETETNERHEIREELRSMSFEEIMKLKEELGAKAYNEAVLGSTNDVKRKHAKKGDNELKRLNKNRPREMSTKRQVPFLGSDLRTPRKNATALRDPRFDENSGSYDAKVFKENYKFLSKVRQKEAKQLRLQLAETVQDDERKQIKQAIQRLVNKNVEERRWHEKQHTLKQEQKEIEQARAEGKQPHYTTKKERRTKDLVKQFEQLKRSGKLNKHLEKRRKKNAAKDRKKISFD